MTDSNPKSDQSVAAQSANVEAKTVVGDSAASAVPSVVVNAWSRKPNIKPDESAAKAANIQSIAVQAATGPGTQAAAVVDLPQRKFNRSFQGNGQRRQSDNFGNNGGNGARRQHPQNPYYANNQQASYTMPNSAASSSGNLPRQFNTRTANNSNQSINNGFAAGDNFVTFNGGAVMPESVGTIVDEQGRVPVPVVPIPAYRNNTVIFDSIQRVRSAPPNVAEQQKTVNANLPHESAESGAPKQGQARPSTRNGVPMMMDPSSQAFNPIAYAPRPGMFYPAPGPQMYIPYPVPPTFTPAAGQPMPQYMPSVMPVDASNPVVPAGPRPYVSEFVPGRSAMPVPIVVPPTGAPAGEAPKIEFKIAKSKAIKLVNPDTKEEVHLPAKEKKTTASAAGSEAGSAPASTTASPEKKIVKASPEKPVTPAPVTPQSSPSKAIEIKAPTPDIAAKASPVKPVVQAAPVSPPKSESVHTASATQSPKSVSPAAAKASGKTRYSIDFILKFKDLHTERPAGMPPMEAIVGEDGAASAQNQNRRNSRKLERTSSGSQPSRSRQSEIGTRSTGRGGRGSGGRMPPGLAPPGRQSMGGSIGRKTGARMSRQSSHDEEFNALKSETGWKPQSLVRSTEGDLDEIYGRKVRALLNKLTVEKFGPISKEIMDLEITSFAQLRCLIDSIFEKAITESNFAEMYAQLCYHLTGNLSDFKPEVKESVIESIMDIAMASKNAEEQNGLKSLLKEPSKKGMFRRSVLLQCQQEFEKKSEWTTTEEIRITDDMSQEDLDRYIAENNRRKKLKQRTLGNIKFIGELFKLQCLSIRIMHSCFGLLLGVSKDSRKSPEEEDLESACDLFATIGKQVQEKIEPEVMNQFFDVLHKCSKDTNIQSRIRFKILDIIELRKRGWVERSRQQNMNAGPMKLKDVQKTASSQQSIMQEIKQAAKQAKFSKPVEKPKRVEKKILERPKKGGPKIHEAAVDKKPDLETAASTLPSASSSSSEINKTNYFDALVDEEHNEEEEEFIDTPEPGSESRVFIEPAKDVKEMKETTEYIDRKLAKDFAEASLESFDKAFKVFVNVRSFVEDDIVEEITEKALLKLLENISAEAFKLLTNQDSETKVRSFAETFSRIYSLELIPQAQLDLILEEQIMAMPDTAVDVPGYDLCLGYVVGTLIRDEVFGFDFPQSCIAKMVEDMGDFTPTTRPSMLSVDPPSVAKFFGAVLKQIKWYESENCEIIKKQFIPYVQHEFAALYEGASYDVKNTVPALLKSPWWGTNIDKLADIPDASIAKWLYDFGVLDMVAPNFSMLLDMNNVTIMEIKTKSESDSNVEKVSKIFAEAVNAASDVAEKTALFRICTSFLAQHVHRLVALTTKVEEPEWIEKEQERMKKWFSVLKVSSVPPSQQKQLQLEIIYAVQKFGTAGQPKKVDRYFHYAFETLYDLEVIDEAAFKEWESDSTRQMDTKEVVMIRGAREFLKWLVEAEVEP